MEQEKNRIEDTLEEQMEETAGEQEYAAGEEARPETGEWTGETQRRPGILSPFTEFYSLSDKQKGTYILIIGIGAILLGLVMVAKLLIENL